MSKFCKFFILFLVICAFSVTGIAYAGVDVKYVYVAGTPIGISVNADGLIIDGLSDVITDDGRVSPFGETDVTSGDIIISIDGKAIRRRDDIIRALNESGDEIEIEIKRKEKILNYKIRPAVESLNKEKRLGIIVKEDVSGIGTLTFVSENKRFVALGHAIYDGKVDYRELQDGNIYKSSILGVNIGKRGAPGELKGIFSAAEINILGTIDSNTSFGIYGNYVGETNRFKRYEICSKSDVQTGRAQILCTIEGDVPKFYDVEIVKATAQSAEAEKGLIVRVTDNTLIGKTGGIVQGMSGSPIIQNGKLIGALTHVFINDPLRGYGVYADFLINK